MELIREKEPEAYAVLEAANVDEDTLLEFTRADLQDLFIGVEHFMLRRRLWKILENLSESKEDSNEKLKTKSPKPCQFKPIDIPFTPDQPSRCSTPDQPSRSSTPDQPSRSSTPNQPPRSSTPSSTSSFVEAQDDTVVMLHRTPAFLMYSDSELNYLADSESLSDDLRNRLVRNTLINMQTSCQSLPTPREPTNAEMEEMAKALVRKFPCVGRLFDNNEKEFKTLTTEERSTLTKEQKSQLHTFIFNKLKKRHANTRPVKRPQGKVPSRSYKRIKLELPKRTIIDEIDGAKEDSNSSTTCSEATGSDTSTSDSTVDARHYTYLDKEQRKSKPNKSVINKYLNVEFASRRKHLENMAKQERPSAILEDYPCFKDPCEMAEEVRRTLKLPEESDQASFMNKCVKNLSTKLDPLIYFGISKGAIKPPTNVTNDGKIIHLLKGINDIFKPKGKLTSKQQKANEIFHIVEGDEGPSDWQKKRSVCAPGLAVSSNGAALLLGRDIFIIFKEDEMMQAIIALLACFYLLDLDYPLGSIIAFSILQKIVFLDNTFHPDCQADVVKAWKDLDLYIN